MQPMVPQSCSCAATCTRPSEILCCCNTSCSQHLRQRGPPGLVVSRPPLCSCQEHCDKLPRSKLRSRRGHMTGFLMITVTAAKKSSTF